MKAEDLVEYIKLKLGELAKEVTMRKGHVEILVKPEDLVNAAIILRELGFDHVKSVTAVDYPKESKIRVTYHASSYLNEELSKYIVGLSVDTERQSPSVDSLVRVWRSAELLEREAYEFFGIHFRGHPDLRPLLLIPELAEKKVLRKDFVVKEEGIYEGPGT